MSADRRAGGDCVDTVDEIQKRLPERWQLATLGNVIRGFETGRNFQAAGVPAKAGETGVLKISAVTWGRFDPSANKALLPGSEPLPHERIKAGDLLISRANTTELVGAPVLVEQDYPHLMLPDKILRVLYDSELVDPRFLLQALRSKEARSHIEENATGSSDSMRNLSQPKLREIPIPVPPLPEQKRIADKLDRLLARVDACRERLDRVPALLKHFRQSVLAAATSGELTREWREERGRDLSNWEQTTVAAVLIGKPRNGYSPRAVEYPTPVKSLTLSATTSGNFRSECFKYIDEPIPADSHLWLSPGDILIQRANTLEYVGVSAIYDGPTGTFIYPDLMMKCQANSRILTEFLHHVLSSESVRKFFRENATGTAGNMPKINQQTVLAAPLMLPPKDEQQEIVTRTKALLDFADQLEQRLGTARELAKNMAPATLAKAFRGELVPQDPTNEPATALLARIAASQAAEFPSKVGLGRVSTKAVAQHLPER